MMLQSLTTMLFSLDNVVNCYTMSRKGCIFALSKNDKVF